MRFKEIDLLPSPMHSLSQASIHFKLLFRAYFEVLLSLYKGMCWQLAADG